MNTEKLHEINVELIDSLGNGFVTLLHSIYREGYEDAVNEITDAMSAELSHFLRGDDWDVSKLFENVVSILDFFNAEYVEDEDDE